MHGFSSNDAPVGVRQQQPDITLLFVLSALAFLALGWLIYQIVPLPPPGPSRAAGLLIQSANLLQPEPAERYTYIFLTSMVPLVLHTVVLAARRWPSLLRPPPWMAAVLVAAAVYLAIPNDPDRGALTFGGIEALGWIGVAVAAVIAILVKLFPVPISRKAIGIASCVFAVALAATWRVRDAGSLMDTAGHFDAFFYSIAQTYYGRTCLVDVLPQYGCYGEFLAPLLHLTGLSVLKLSLLMLAFQGLALIATVMFARGMIRNRLILITTVAWVLVVQNRVLWPTVSPDPYFQYWPLRTLFPASSLLMVWWWQARPGFAKAVSIGIFAGLGIFWNLDSGAIVLLALSGFVLFSGATASRSLDDRLWLRNIGYGAALLLCAAVAAGAFAGWLWLKSGQPVPITNYLVYQRAFYIRGFEMIRMPELPDMWVVALALALVALLKVAVRIGTGPYAPRAERAAYLAVLAIGLFSYFNGRSNVLVFLHVSWPFVLLLGYLADSALTNAKLTGNRIMAAMVGVLAVALLFASSADLLAGSPVLFKTALAQDRDIISPDPDNVLRREAAFIRSVAKAGEPIAILAYDQGALIAGAGRGSDIRGPGLIEMLRTQDAEDQISALVTNGPKHLFVGKSLLNDAAQTWGSVPWVQQAMPRLEQVYQIDQTNENPELLHLVRRPGGSAKQN